MRIRYAPTVDDLVELLWDENGAVSTKLLQVLAESVEARIREEFVSDLYYLIHLLQEQGASRQHIAQRVIEELRPDDPPTDGDDIPLTWGSSADMAVSHLVVTRTRPDGTTETVHDGPVAPRGKFPIKSHGLGYFRATLVATDDDNDRPGDSQSVTVSHDVTVVDDDVNAPTAAFDHPRVSLQPDATNLTWGYSPDVAAAFLTVSRDGVTLFDGRAPASGSYDFGNTLGNHTATLTVTDDHADTLGDSQSSSTSQSLTVVDDNVSAPIVGAGCDLLVTGNGGGVVVGDADNDIIVGAGRDVAISRESSDLVVSLANDDILVAGFTPPDVNVAAQRRIFKEQSCTELR
jgi:hypothetical protein